jgi:hypothetical protein
MSTAYLDSAGNVNTAIANDVQNFQFAVAQAAAVPNAATQAALAVVSAQVGTDNITGLPSAGSLTSP